MEIIIWVLFTISILLTCGGIAIIYIGTTEENYTEEGPIYLFLINFLFSGFAYLAASYLFSAEASIWIWKSSNLFSILNLSICSVLRYKRIHKHWFWTIILSVPLAAIPFLINIQFNQDTNPITLFLAINNYYPKILFSLWIPLLGIITVSSLLYKSVLDSKRNTEIRRLHSMLEAERSLQITETDRHLSRGDKSRISEFGDKISRNLYEEFQRSQERMLMRQEDLFYRQREMMEILMQNNGATNKSSQRLDVDDKKLLEISNTLNSLNSKLELLNKEKHIEGNGFYSNATNQNFIRELYHYLVTPLSQIESKAIILNHDPLAILKNEDKLIKTISTINTSIEICKSVLAAYRELAFVTSFSDWSPKSLSQSIKAAANLYKESMEKDVKIVSNIFDDLPQYSNNYLLAVLLPLLENAIKASPINKEVNIGYQIFESKIFITIDNEAIDMPTIEHLNTPGFSSKKDHKGTGLLIARHLIEDQNSGTLTFEIRELTITTIISLPNRKAI